MSEIHKKYSCWFDMSLHYKLTPETMLLSACCHGNSGHKAMISQHHLDQTSQELVLMSLYFF